MDAQSRLQSQERLDLEPAPVSGSLNHLSPMCHILRRNPDPQRGAVAVEFAIISILLFTILFGIIEFGIFFSRYQVFNGAAREGARVASTRGTEAAVTARVIDAAGPYESDVTGPISTTVEGGGGVGTPCSEENQGSKVTVSWDQNFEDAIVLPFVPDIDFTIQMKGVFRCE